MPAKTVIQTRRDTAANWASANPTLAAGEWGLETDTGYTKIGDGTTAWNSLRLASSPAWTSMTPYQFVSGRYYDQSYLAAAANQALTMDRVHYTPFLVPQTTTFDRIAVIISAGLASCTVKLGIYNVNLSTQRPSTLILDCGSIDASTSGTKTITISQSLNPGLYALAALPQGGASTLTIAGFSGNNSYISFADPASASCWLQTGVTGNLPSPASANTLLFASPRIWVRAA